jgi:glycosyltransferase involved in cell wall biosynthesis
MTAGVPVVASNRGSLPDLLGDAGSLVDPDDASDLAHAIEAMLTDQAYADRCAALGVERARMFRWARTAERVYEAYQRAIERRARRARGA